MKIKKILLIFKKSLYRLKVMEGKNKKISRLLEQNHVIVKRVISSHQCHKNSLEIVKRVLKSFGFDVDERYRFTGININDYHLVVLVGGDGTLLKVAPHLKKDTPVLLVNSSPADSAGFFSVCQANQLESILEHIMDGKNKPVKLPRLQYSIGGQKQPNPVLNDLLFTNISPAASTRYFISIDDTIEEQKSSGIWISTAAGSTGGIRSAGGKLMPLLSKRIQYLVREPYQHGKPCYQLCGGIINYQQKLKLISKTMKAELYADGIHARHQVEFGETIEISPHAESLKLFCHPREVK